MKLPRRSGKKPQKKYELFRQLLEDVTPRLKLVKKLDLFGFLILPIQRVPRYGLLLSDLLKRTYKHHPDYENLSKAVQEISKAGSVLNNARKQDEDLKRTTDLIKKFREPRAIESMLAGSSNKGCLYEGDVLLRSDEDGNGKSDKKPIKAHLFLFADQIVFAKKNLDKKMDGKNLKMWRNTVKFSDASSYSIDQLTSNPTPITSPDQFDFGFTIAVDKQLLRVYPSSLEVRDTWIQLITKARNHK